jgi:type II secretory pathway pseudopilin PulG
MQRVVRSFPPVKSGLTLIDLIVVLAVVGLLLSLLIPAVQQARHAARGVECKNNVRQIGAASHNHVDHHGRFPGPAFSTELLPNLDQLPLFQRIEDRLIVPPMNPENLPSYPLFEGASIPVYQCPVDPLAAATQGLAPSYRINSGSGFGESIDGMYARTPSNALIGVRPQEVSDGLSQTVFFSERLIGLGRDAYADTPNVHTRRRLMATTDRMRDPDQIDLFAQTCESRPAWIPAEPPPCYLVLSCWVSFNHIMTPNSNSCFNGPFSLNDDNSSHAAMTATSLHQGGVHVLMADGAARFVSDSIDRSVWRALGTRAGGEPIAAGLF